MPNLPRSHSATSRDTQVSFSIKDLFGKLESKIDSMAAQVQGLESKFQTQAQINELILRIDQDFRGITDRFNAHERLDVHDTGSSKMVLLRAEVDALKQESVTEKSLKEYMEKHEATARTNRNWVIGLVTTNVLAIAGLIFKAVFG